MSEAKNTQDDEFDFFSLFEIMWAGKLKIIIVTFISTLLGLGFIFFKDDSFSLTTVFKPAPYFKFTKFSEINDIIKNNSHISFNEKYEINSLNIFDKIVTEFNDLNEVTTVLEKIPHINQKLSGLDKESKILILNDYAKNFKITPPMGKYDKNWKASFLWNDVKEGKQIYNDAMSMVLDNVRGSLYAEINDYASTIDRKLNQEIKKINSQLISLIFQEKNRTNKRLVFLNEQAQLAQGLGIKNSSITKYEPYLRNYQNINIPYYIRGFEAIKLEIKMIKARSNEDTLLLSLNYLNLKDNLRNLESDMTSSNLRKMVDLIQKIENDDLVSFDLSLGNIVVHNKTLLYLIISILLGGMLGMFYVAISNSAQKRNARLKV